MEEVVGYVFLPESLEQSLEVQIYDGGLVSSNCAAVHRRIQQNASEFGGN